MGSKNRGASSVEVETTCTCSMDFQGRARRRVYTRCELCHMLERCASTATTRLSKFSKTCRASTGTASCTYETTSRTSTPTSCCRESRQSGPTRSGKSLFTYTCRQAAARTAEPTEGLHDIGMRSADHSQRGPRKTTRLCGMRFDSCAQYTCTRRRRLSRSKIPSPSPSSWCRSSPNFGRSRGGGG